MEKAIVLNTDDVKLIIAERFNVDVSKVIKSQYSFTVIGVDKAVQDGAGEESGK